MLDRTEYRSRIWDQIEDFAMANFVSGMDFFDMLDMVLASGDIDYVYGEDAEPYLVKEILTDVMITHDMME